MKKFITVALITLSSTVFVPSSYAVDAWDGVYRMRGSLQSSSMCRYGITATVKGMEVHFWFRNIMTHETAERTALLQEDGTFNLVAKAKNGSGDKVSGQIVGRQRKHGVISWNMTGLFADSACDPVQFSGYRHQAITNARAPGARTAPPPRMPKGATVYVE